jgi:alpha,alpha-trehalose phosphorylase
VTSAAFDAVLLDMDGVLTSTARLHAACWKQTFDTFLTRWDEEHGTTTTPFSIADDYTVSVDGKPREDGVRDFLRTRGIVLPEGADVTHPAGPKLHRLQAATERLLAAEGDFPIEPDRIVERRFNLVHVPQVETIFALSNGYLGIRGVHDEGNPSYDPGALLNGFYESWPIVYPENAYGFAETGQTIVPLPDGSVVRLFVDGEPFLVHKAELLEYERVLDMAAGVLERRVDWRDYDGSRYSLRTQRMVSCDFRNLACIEYELTALDRPARFTISSELLTHQPKLEAGFDPRRASSLGPDVLTPLVRQERDGRVVLALETRSSGMRMACGAHHDLSADGPWEFHVDFPEGSSARAVFRVNGEVGRPVRLVKYLAYQHEQNESATELCFRVNETLDRARNTGIDRLREGQRQHLDQFWRDTGIDVDGAPLLEQAIRFNLFQLLQASGGVAGYGIPAKGLTGRGYEGHYFWDTEIYVMPFLTYTAPNAARALVRHRYDMLQHARQRARQVGNRGALFPWRTISGDEASAYYAAGTAQYHIDADIAYALTQYVNATHDYEAMARFGVEILIETARLWADLGFFSARKSGCFVINGVTGPDEYSTVVDNNLFTNLMAAENLRTAARAVTWLAEHRPDDFARLRARMDLIDDEPIEWQRAADRMYVPYDERREIHLQDDEFLERELWDFEHTPPERYPLLLHYHPLVIYRHQVIKQADVVLAAFLLGERFTRDEKQRIFEYYDPLTTGDSSLSECIQSIVAAELGDLRTAEEYLVDAIAIDLADVAGNVRDGIHLAAAAVAGWRWSLASEASGTEGRTRRSGPSYLSG